MNVLNAHVEDLSLDERSNKLVTLAVESFGRLGSELFDELTTTVVGGRDEGQWPRKQSARNAFCR